MTFHAMHADSVSLQTSKFPGMPLRQLKDTGTPQCKEYAPWYM